MTDGKVHLYDGKVLNENGVVALCDDDCCGPLVDCTYCLDDKAPEEFLVEIAGVTNGICSYCNGINQNIVCSFMGISSLPPCGVSAACPGWGGVGGCRWGKTYSGTVCYSDPPAGLNATIIIGPNLLTVEIYGTVIWPSVEYGIRWQKAFPGPFPPNCLTFAEEDIPYMGCCCVGCGASPICDGSGSTCKLTSL